LAGLKNQEEQGIGRQLLAEFALPRRGGVERGKVIVELKSVRGDVVAREIQLANHAEGVTNPPFAG